MVQTINYDDNTSEKVAKADFFSVRSSTEFTTNPTVESLKMGKSTSPSAQVQETTVDDLSFIDCSKYLRMREITVYSQDYIKGINVKYRLPTGQTLESIHSGSAGDKSKALSNEDCHEWKSLTLDPAESVNQVS
jgi:hypothetical protein